MSAGHAPEETLDKARLGWPHSLFVKTQQPTYSCPKVDFSLTSFLGGMASKKTGTLSLP